MFTLAELEDVLPIVRTGVPPTPQYAWPLLKTRTGVDVVVKHENPTPIGAFKLRGSRSPMASSRRRAATTASRSPQPARAPACR